MKLMKIEPVKNYKKPQYAVKIASILTAASSLAGCGTIPQVQLSGEETSVEESTLVTTTAATEEVMLDGDISVEEMTTTEPQLDGDIVIIDDTDTTPAKTTATTTNVELAGDIAIIGQTNTTQTTTITSRTTTRPTTLELGGVLTTATEETELITDGTAPIYTTTQTTILTTPGDVPLYTETTTEVATAGVAPMFTKTTEVTLAGEPVLPME